MAADFFQREKKARWSTVWLLVMFSLATLVVIASVMAVTPLALMFQMGNVGPPSTFQPSPWPAPVLAGAAALLLTLGSSLYKLIPFGAGGEALVAQRMGGVRIDPNTTNSVERRLLNVVEEMAIASGVAVPPVFLLRRELGINTFAAGYRPDDAVLGVTRGCAERLTREEFQGVLAHDFGHILNVDTRIALRMMEILHGILLRGLVGHLLLRWAALSGRSTSSRRNSDSDNLFLVAILIATGLVVLGFFGTFLGNLIKTAISRQRERLADASGVQFTRNPLRLAGALERIGALETGSGLVAPHTAEASHLFFAEGVWRVLAGLWSTHPPLAERIRALDPSWDGKDPPADEGAARVQHELSALV